MADHRTEKENGTEAKEEDEDMRKKKSADPELFSCLLQPVSSDADLQYIGVRRLLLRRKAESGVVRRLVRDSCLLSLLGLSFSRIS